MSNGRWRYSPGIRNILAYMPGIGKIKAATTASDLRATFRNIELFLVIGICGGTPRLQMNRTSFEKM